jgi:hypothetical protein
MAVKTALFSDVTQYTQVEYSDVSEETALLGKGKVVPVLN